MSLHIVDIPLKMFNTRFAFLLREPFRSIPVQLLYGGASSGKSVFVAQRDILDMVNEHRNFLCVRNVTNTIRGSMFAERIKAIRSFGFRPLFDVRESDLHITYKPRGTVMIFRGLDDVEKLKSITVPNGSITDIRYEEPTEMSEADVAVVGDRMRGMSTVPKREVFSFNPTFRSHWLSRKYFNGQLIKYKSGVSDGILILHTTYHDNKFLTRQDRERIERHTGYQRMVYTQGEWGVLGDLIFTNWTVEDLTDVEFDTYRYGLDFGFAADPSTVLKVHINRERNTIYVKKELYIHGAKNNVLATKAKLIVGEAPVWCDSAEPKSIAELREYGLSAHPVVKGKDSVWHAIQWLQQWRLIIDKTCTHTIDELSQYQWQKNRAGETLPEPVGTNDHTIAALRYATERDRLGAGVSIVV